MWNRLWVFLSDHEGWKSVCGIVYLIICFFDFVVVPSWIGLTRQDTLLGLSMMDLKDLDPSVQIEMIRAMTLQHEPFTLKGAGMFHLAFGALLTGSALTSIRRKNKPKQSDEDSVFR